MIKPKRQEPLWMIILFVNRLKPFIIPLTFIFIINFKSLESIIIYAGSFLILFVLINATVSIFEWRNFTYLVANNNIEISDGRFIAKKRYITLNKIQSVQEDRSLLHRMFGLTSLTITTGTSGDNAAVRLDALVPEDAEELKALLKSEAQTHELDTDELTLDSQQTNHHYSMSFKEILLISITSLYFLAFIPLAISGYFRINNFFNIDDYTDSFVNLVKTSYLLIIFLILGAFLISSLIGFIVTFLNYGKYEVTSNEERIFITKGILSTSHFSIPKDRVNGIIIKKPFFRRLFGIVEVQIITLGDLFESEESQTDILFPFINLNLATHLVEEILPDYAIEKKMNQLPGKSLILTLIKPSYLLVIITVLTFSIYPEYWFIPIIYLLFILIQRVVEHYNSKYLMTDQFIQMQAGSFSSELSILKKNNVDALSVNESWLQRRFNLSTLRAMTRAKPTHTSFIVHLPKDTAVNTYNWYAESLHKDE